jgi:glycosyltransferase (activator-dependent family)
MRVLFTTFAAKSHLNIQVPIAWSLRAAGHDVRVASQPDLVDYIRQTGLPAVSVGEPLALPEQMAGDGDEEDVDFAELADLTGRQPQRRTYEYLHTAITLSTLVYRTLSSDSTVTDLVELALAWQPDLVVWDTMTFAGAVAAAASGASHARLLFGLDLLGQARRTYRQYLDDPDRRLADPFRTWLAPLLERYGAGFDEQAVLGQWTIDPVPASVGLATSDPRVPIRYVPYHGPTTVPAWLSATPSRPRVCLTLGQTGRDVLGGDRSDVGQLLAALADLDVEIVATLDHTQVSGLPAMPANVRIVDFVPLDALLPSCAAVVHHGGSGSMQTALFHGVPQVVVPDMMWDTEYKAELVQKAGAGVLVRAADATAESLRAAVQRVLTEPSFAAAATKLRREMRAAPTPAATVPVLERLTRHHRAQFPAGTR